MRVFLIPQLDRRIQALLGERVVPAFEVSEAEASDAADQQVLATLRASTRTT